MIYRNYAGRWNQAGWRRPGSVWGARRSGYRPGYRPGAFRWQANRRFGYRPGIYAGRRWPRFGAAPARRWGFLARPGRGFGFAPAIGLPQPPAPDTPQVQALPPQWIQWAQSCLAQAVGPWVPQDGNMGPATRKAISIFQQKQQLPPSGMLDAATVTALQAACSPQPAAPAAAPAPPSGDDVAAASAAASGGAAPDAGAAPPDGAASPDPSAGAPADAPAGELFMRRMRSMRGRGHRRHRRQWGSGFNFQPAYQPQQTDDDDDDSQELFMHGGWGRQRGWGGGGYQQPDNDGGNPWGRRRW